MHSRRRRVLEHLVTRGILSEALVARSHHARLLAAARNMENIDVTDDECANGVRLFLRKRS